MAANKDGKFMIVLASADAGFIEMGEMEWLSVGGVET